MSLVVLLYLLLGGGLQGPSSVGEDQRGLEILFRDGVRENYLNDMLQILYQEIDSLSQTAPEEDKLYWSWEECALKIQNVMHRHWLLGVELILCGLIFWGLCSRRRWWKREPKAEPEEESEEESEVEPEEESVIEQEADPEEESEKESVAEQEADPEVEQEAGQEEETEEESVAEPEADPEVKLEVEPEEESVAEPEADSEIEPETDPEVEKEAESEEEPVAEPEAGQEEESEEESVAEPEGDQEVEPEVELEVESVAEPEANPEVEPEVEPEEESVPDPEIEPKEESVAEPEADPEVESVAEPEANPEVEPEVEPEEESVPDPEIEPKEESVAEPEADPEEESVAEPEANPEANPEVEPEEKPEKESVPDPEIEPKEESVAEPEADPEEESVAEPEANPEANPEVEPEEKPEKESVPDPEIEPKEESVAEPEADPEEESVAEPEANPEANPEVEPEEKPEKESVPDPEIEPKEESVAEPEANPEANPEVEPEEKPEKESVPDPEIEPKEESVAEPEADPEVKPEVEPNTEAWTKRQLIANLKVISKGGVAGDRDRDIRFVQEVVEHLLDVARDSSQLYTDMLQEGCVGVGSQFEGGWSSGRQQEPDFDMLVVINPPRTLSFQVELGYNDASNPLAWEAPPDYRGQGRVRLISTSPPSQGVPPRPHEPKSSLDWMGPGEHLEPALVLQWLGSTLKKAWDQRKTMKVTFGGAECPCRLQLENPSGRRLYVNLVPAVRVEGTNAFLVTQGPVLRPPEHWVQWFSVDEGNFLRDVTQKMPSNSCHLKCLHMLSVANTQPASLSPEDPESSFLTSYHLKTIVLYMLFRWPDPQDWTQRQLSRQLQIALGVLEKHLECKWLPHCVQGSRDLGSLQGMPPVFPHTSSVNLFEPLKQDPHQHMVAMKDFRRLTTRLRMFTRSFCEKTRLRNSEITENRLNEWPL